MLQPAVGQEEEGAGGAEQADAVLAVGAPGDGLGPTGRVYIVRLVETGESAAGGLSIEAPVVSAGSSGVRGFGRSLAALQGALRVTGTAGLAVCDEAGLTALVLDNDTYAVGDMHRTAETDPLI